MKILRQFIVFNQSLSRLFDSMLPKKVRKDGNKHFLQELLPKALQQGNVIYDVGGGSQPSITSSEKKRFNIYLTGVDISSDELSAAPEGVYDNTISADICTFEGAGDGDIVICQALLEHVPDTSGAIKSMASILKPGGRLFVFVPSRNAVFARINLLLPENIKQKVLFTLFPKKATGHDGFKAYYDHCTPKQIEVLAKQNNLTIEEKHLFWASSYFTIFTPIFIIWRIWQLISFIVIRDNSAETFSYILTKNIDVKIQK